MRLAPESSSVNIVSREFKVDPFPFYARLRAEQPVCCVTVPGLGSTWLVTRYDDVVAVLKDSRFAKNPQHALTQPWLPSFAKPLQRDMLDLDEPDHARLRTLVHKAFTPSMVERLQERDSPSTLVARTHNKVVLRHPPEYTQVQFRIVEESLPCPVRAVGFLVSAFLVQLYSPALRRHTLLALGKQQLDEGRLTAGRW